MRYKINTKIIVRYLSVDYIIGISDLQLTPVTPAGADGTPVLFSEIGYGLYEAEFTPNSVGWWSARISSATYPDNIYSKSYYVNTTQEISIWNKEENKAVTITTDGFKERLDTNALLDPNSVSFGVIKSGISSNVATVDAQGRLYVYVPPTQTNLSMQIAYERSESPIKAGQWQTGGQYTVPAEYDLNIIVFDGYDGVNGGSARAINMKALGEFNCTTGTFRDGSSWTLPSFATKLYAYVTTQTGAGNDTITVTYTNSLGVTGRTATVILKANVVGERIEIPLQTGDIGIIDVTNVTQNLVQAGVFTLEATYALAFLLLTTSNTLYNVVAPLSSMIVSAGETVYLQYRPSNNSNVIRRVSILGTLVQR